MRTQVIAEVASNHGGDIKLAKEFIRLGADVGVDFVKFQSWQASKMSPQDSQYDWFKKSELSDAAHDELKAECDMRGVGFLTTVFDRGRVDFLARLTPTILKVGSADTMNLDLLRAIKGRFEHLLVSTGMATDSEIAEAAKTLAGTSFSFFHTLSLYPTPLEENNLRRMDWLKQFTPSVGYSDHTIGIDAVKMAIDREAAYVEKHFCLSAEGPGRVCEWDATPKMFEEIVKYTTRPETMLGSGKFQSSPPLEAARKRFIGRFSHSK